MEDCSPDFLMIYSHLMPSQSHPAFVSSRCRKGHRANASVFSPESAQGISTGWKNSHRYTSEAAQGLMRMCVCVWIRLSLSLTAPRSSLLPSTGTLFLSSFPFSLSPIINLTLSHNSLHGRERACCPCSFFFHARVHLKFSLLQICGPCTLCMFVWRSQKSISHVWGWCPETETERETNKPGKEWGS